MTKQFLTASASGLTEENGWKIKQISNVLFDIAPRVILNNAKANKIDNELNDQLLDQSLLEFGDIWRSLARK
ncbi:MAG: hypothetical protein QGD88_12265 [Anaerolineae bacterium]|nr:hypothetical protein [Anaerolineae bacterium]